VHEQWSNGKVLVMVATNAFGLGIHKPDVRFVIHHSISKAMETYYQATHLSHPTQNTQHKFSHLFML